MSAVDTYPCPSCGFLVFKERPGSYDLCDVCGWEDDVVQLKHPGLPNGANELSLIEHQQSVLASIPLHIRAHRGYERDSTWRPFKPSEKKALLQVPTSNDEYMRAFKDDASSIYYWCHVA